MNLQELIDFHISGAESCEAYAITPGASEAKNKDIAKHYTKRAKWHRDAVELMKATQPQGEPVALQHMAVSEAGVLRWMTGRKMQDCELYAMPDGSPIRSKLYTEQPAPVAVVMPERDVLRDLIAGAIGGDTYDCTRVWSAWGVGTMSEDDFVPVVEQDERLHEIADSFLAEVARLNGVKP